MRYFLLVIVFPLTLNSCYSRRNDKISYKMDYDTLNHIPAFSQYTFFETKDTLFFCTKPWHCDSLSVHYMNDQGEWVLRSFLQIPKAYTDSTSTDEVEEWIFINMDTVIAYTAYADFTFLDIRNGCIIRSVPENTDNMQELYIYYIILSIKIPKINMYF